MRIFLDANIIVSVLNKEYPVFSNSARILSLADDKKYEVFTSPLCLAIAFYFAEKKSGSKLAKQKIELLVDKLSITSISAVDVTQALEDNRVHDFEDSLEYYSAIKHKCHYIITEDRADFYFSEIPVYNSQHFIERLMQGKL